MTSEGSIAASGLVPTRYDEDTQVVMREPAPRDASSSRPTPWCSPTASGASALRGRAGHRQPVRPADLRCSRPSPSCCASAAPSSSRSRCRARWTAGSTTWSTRRRCRRRSAPLADVPPQAAAAAEPARRPTAEIWFAPELRYLPVRIRIEQDAATFVDLMIARQARDRRRSVARRRTVACFERQRRHDHDLRMHPHRDARRRRAPHRPDHAEPAEAAQRAQRRADGRARRRAARPSTPTTASAASSSPAARRRSPPAPTSRRWRPTASSTPTRKGFITPQLGDDPPGAQAGDRRGGRLRARRRLRAGDDVRLRHRRRQREVRPARDQARHHPRRRRHAAPAARGRQGQGDGPGPDRAHDGRRRGRARRPGLARRAGRRAARRGARRGGDDLRASAGRA